MALEHQDERETVEAKVQIWDLAKIPGPWEASWRSWCGSGSPTWRFLFGAEFNSELQRSQQIEAGEPAPLDEPFLEPRDTRTLDKKAEK